MLLAAAAALELIMIVTLDGRNVLVNPKQIVSISEPSESRDAKDKLMTDKVHCVVNLTNGTFISIAEDCPSLRQRLKQ